MSLNIKTEDGRNIVAGNLDPSELNEIRQDLTQFVGGDEWTQKTYNKGDACIHNNKAWVCLATTTVEPSASATTYWKQINLKELNNISQYDGTSIICKKNNKVVEVRFDNFTGGTVPQGYRPLHSANAFGYDLTNRQFVFVGVGTDGSVRVANSSNTVVSGYKLYATVNFISE